MNEKNEDSTQLKYIGQIGFQIILGLSIILLSIGFALSFETLMEKDKLYLIFASPFLIIPTIHIFRNLTTQIREIRINKNSIILQNKLTRKQIELSLADIMGFRYNSRKHKVYLIDKNNQIATTVYDPFYKDLRIFFENNGVDYLGRSKSWFSA